MRGPAEVATVVALRRGRVLMVAQPGSGVLALPGGKVERGETTGEAAARELREETGIVVAAERLRALEGPITVAASGVSLHPFVLLHPPRPAGRAELSRRWIALEGLSRMPLAAAVARTVHQALASAAIPQEVPGRLLDWWATQAQRLPWRATRDPYAVLVCEVMSQQTQIDRVPAYWERWLARWPTADALAHASRAEALRAWQGLGYPRRARDLHAAAQRIATAGWPAPERLAELPGVGRYTADAIRCFALGQPVLPRDANVSRVLARRFPGGIAAGQDPWSLAGALMDLGRTHCRARPRCELCPLHEGCLVALEGGDWDPARPRRPQKPYTGSLRQRRGALLRAALAGERPPSARDPQAAASLLADGLVAARRGVLVPPRPVVVAPPCSS